MPTIITHAMLGLPISVSILKKKQTRKIVILSMLCAVIPDIDGIGYFFGIPYNSIFGHRGFSHSILFIFFLAFFMVYLFFRDLKLWSRQFNVLFFNFLIIGFSHIIFDAMTSGGLGVAFFSPFSGQRFFLPWRPVPVSAILPRYFFALDGLRVLRAELLYFILPSIFYSYFVAKFYKKRGLKA